MVIIPIVAGFGNSQLETSYVLNKHIYQIKDKYDQG